MEKSRRRYLAHIPFVPLLLLVAPLSASAQVELLPLEHPATALLVRLAERGALPELPLEHLPISRGSALAYLERASTDSALPQSMLEQARWYRDQLRYELGLAPPAELVPLPGGESFWSDPFADRPVVILDHTTSDEPNAHVAFEPVGSVEVRLDPESSQQVLIGLLGAQLRGSVGGHLGFAGRITNGSIAGDLDLAARDPAILRNGSFGITGLGRDLGFGSGHIRGEWGGVGLEIGHERVVLGTGGGRSLLLSSDLPTLFDHLRLTATFGKFSFSHLHAAVQSAPTGVERGPFAEIPAKYLAAHLLSVGPFGGVRLSIGESVIYHGRLELAYLNPMLFLKAQEQQLKDRDNANMYLALGVTPFDGLRFDGELLLDDLKFSRIGDGFWGNKTALRLAATTRGLIVGELDATASYTRLEPYVYTHFNPLNNYTHDSTSLAAGGLAPNSDLLELALRYHLSPRFELGLAIGSGRHGANIRGATAGGADTILLNVGGDIWQTRRAGIDSDTVTFLDGRLEELLSVGLDAAWRPHRSVTLRLQGRFREVMGEGVRRRQEELRFGLVVGPLD